VFAVPGCCFVRWRELDLAAEGGCLGVTAYHPWPKYWPRSDVARNMSPSRREWALLVQYGTDNTGSLEERT